MKPAYPGYTKLLAREMKKIVKYRLSRTKIEAAKRLVGKGVK